MRYPGYGAPGTRVASRDGTNYVVREDGALQRLIPKVKGKAAAKAHKRQRRQRRLYPASQEVQMAHEGAEEKDTPNTEPPAQEIPASAPQGDGDGGDAPAQQSAAE